MIKPVHGSMAFYLTMWTSPSQRYGEDKNESDHVDQSMHVCTFNSNKLTMHKAIDHILSCLFILPLGGGLRASIVSPMHIMKNGSNASLGMEKHSHLAYVLKHKQKENSQA